MSDSRDTLNDEVVERSPAAATGRDFDVLQIGFWAALAVAGGVAAMAVTWPGAVGPAGPVLIIACGAMGLVLVLWWLRGAGRRLGIFPERGAAEAAALSARRPTWLDALSEPALIADRGGASVAANSAYLELSQVARDLGDASHAPSVDRLFGANPGMAAPIYRLSKAAKAGVDRTEILPAILFGDAHVPVQFEASVAPLGKSRALWRLRRVEAGSGSGAVDARALYVEDAPVGFFRLVGMVVSSTSIRRSGRCWGFPMIPPAFDLKTSCARKGSSSCDVRSAVRLVSGRKWSCGPVTGSRPRLSLSQHGRPKALTL